MGLGGREGKRERGPYLGRKPSDSMQLPWCFLISDFMTLVEA